MYGLVKLAAYNSEVAGQLEEKYDNSLQEIDRLKGSIPSSIRDRQQQLERKEELRGAAKGTLVGAGIGAGLGSAVAGAKGLGQLALRRPVTNFPKQVGGSAAYGAGLLGLAGTFAGGAVGAGKGHQQGQAILREENPELYQQLENAVDASDRAEDDLVNYEWQAD